MIKIDDPLALFDKNDAPSFALPYMGFLSLLTVLLSFGLLSGRTSHAPGLLMGLPHVEEAQWAASLPHAAILAVYDHDLLLFEGKRCAKRNLGQLMRQHLRQSQPPSDFLSPAKVTQPLLVLMKGTQSLEDLLSLCEIAQSAGFASIQLATQTP